MKKRISKTWKQGRKCKAGGTDVAPICKLSQFRTPLDIYNDKRGIVPDFAGNVWTKTGQILEPFLTDRFETELKELNGDDYSVTVPDEKQIFRGELDYFGGNPDGIILKSGQPVGIVEIKTTQKRINPDRLPYDWQLQILWYKFVLEYHINEFSDFLPDPGNFSDLSYQTNPVLLLIF